jgi:outer membrane protein assembly factor BamD
MFRPRMRSRLLALALVLPFLACATKHVTVTGDLKYGTTAEENYEAGQELLKGEDYANAFKFFEYVRTKFPFSKFSALAELRIADGKLKQDRYVEAADAF